MSRQESLFGPGDYPHVSLQLEAALIAADWLRGTDDALVALARRIAGDLDATGPDQPAAAAKLYSSYARVLEALGLTPLARRQLSSDDVEAFDPWAELQA